MCVSMSRVTHISCEPSSSLFSASMLPVLVGERVGEREREREREKERERRGIRVLIKSTHSLRFPEI